MHRVKQLFLLIILAFTTSNLVAQNINVRHLADSIAQVPDSLYLTTIEEELDSIVSSTINKTLSTEITEITDTIDTKALSQVADISNKKLNKVDIEPFKPSPKKAVIYSAIFPGLGQIYNQKYWKLPIIYGGFVGVSYAVTWNNSHYQDYFGAYKDILDDNPETNSWHNFVPYGQDPEGIDKNWFTGVLKDRKNYFRYYRDLSVIIGVALYGLTIVDAYVDAQLFEFDMSPDLSLRIEPELMKTNNRSYFADSFGIKCSISF